MANVLEAFPQALPVWYDFVPLRFLADVVYVVVLLICLYSILSSAHELLAPG